MPKIVEVVHKETLDPIPFVTTWTAIAPNPNNTYSAIASDLTFIPSNLIEIGCNFIDDNGPVNLELRLNTKVELKYSQGANAIFAFDQNEFSEYGTTYGYDISKPWKFLSTGVADNIEAKIYTKGNSSNAVEFQSNHGGLTLTPIKMTDKKEQILCEFNGQSNTEIEISGCAGNPELNIYTGDPFNIDVKFYFISESDDDVTVGAGTMSASTDICVDVGADGCLDLELDKSWLEGDDEFATADPFTPNHLTVVVAGPDGICNTSARNYNIKNNNAISTRSIIDEANQIFGQLGVTLSESSPAENIFVNFDTIEDDNKVEKYERNTLGTCFRRIVPRDVILPNHVDVLVVKELKKEYSISGFTTSRGYADPGPTKYLVVLSLKDGFNGSTLSHEIGHLLFELMHPREEFSGLIDRYNFMYYSQKDELKDEIIRLDKFRRYQFEKIFNQ